MTGGVFHVDQDIECLLIARDGVTTTNRLEAGKTYQVGNVLLELSSTNATTFFFSGGPMIQAGGNFSLAILSFDQEVENLEATPQKAKFGNHMINLSLDRGEFSIIYPNKNENSFVNVSTPYVDYELTGGLYYFRVSKSSVAYVLEGGMISHGEKGRTDKVEKGSLAVAVSLGDPDSGLEDKFVTSFKKAHSDEMEKFASPVRTAEKKFFDVDFFVIGGKVIGFLLK